MTKTILLAFVALPLAAGDVLAQGSAPAPNPFEQGQSQSQPPGQPPPCVQEFIKLRDVAQKRGQAIQAAAKRKANPKELCGLFNSFVAAEAKVVKFAETKNVWCGIPPQAIEQMKNAHLKSQETRSNVCKVAAQGPRPSGPSLGDALGVTPIPSASNTKKGSGTFDTLTGSPLAR
ncbi:MAG: hypothetical protein AB7T86_06940 [Xanthobacteraceae bacterium]|uniref:hypothetical protein n=1 Tax=Pseudolabrys sp. TaxID=1960880 RepID=UPI003D0F6720